jgi:hypothetical protein
LLSDFAEIIDVRYEHVRKGSKMSPAQKFEKASSKTFNMNKVELKRHIKHFRGSFKLDFTDSYLNSLSADKLRHILVGAMTLGKGK